MGLIDTLKWMWDPRTDEQKRYETDPLRCYTQTLHIYIKGIDTPFNRVLEFKDIQCGDWFIRVDLARDVRDWLGNRAKKGVTIENVWYAPDQIVRIEILEHTVEKI